MKKLFSSIKLTFFILLAGCFGRLLPMQVGRSVSQAEHGSAYDRMVLAETEGFIGSMTTPIVERLLVVFSDEALRGEFVEKMSLAASQGDGAIFRFLMWFLERHVLQERALAQSHVPMLCDALVIRLCREIVIGAESGVDWWPEHLRTGTTLNLFKQVSVAVLNALSCCIKKVVERWKDPCFALLFDVVNFNEPVATEKFIQFIESLGVSRSGAVMTTSKLAIFLEWFQYVVDRRLGKYGTLDLPKGVTDEQFLAVMEGAFEKVTERLALERQLFKSCSLAQPGSGDTGYCFWSADDDMAPAQRAGITAISSSLRHLLEKRRLCIDSIDNVVFSLFAIMSMLSIRRLGDEPSFSHELAVACVFFERIITSDQKSFIFTRGNVLRCFLGCYLVAEKICNESCLAEYVCRLAETIERCSPDLLQELKNPLYLCGQGYDQSLLCFQRTLAATEKQVLAMLGINLSVEAEVVRSFCLHFGLRFEMPAHS